MPIGHAVNANIAMVSAFSIHPDRDEAVRRGQEGFEFFGFALAALVARDSVPGRSEWWDVFQRERAAKRAAAPVTGITRHAPGISTPGDLRAHLRAFEQSGVDQTIFLQQAGKNRHAEICASLELFAAEVLPEFAAAAAEREAKKANELAPYLEAALARKPRLAALADGEIPVVRASVAAPIVNRGAG